mmetsp:Transcript_19407/g.29551  ORF Transcript_19407/g.29551 Transcript_19407/m.29551 type:complete len:656 (+) Transcript_19407:14-1981(+)
MPEKPACMKKRSFFRCCCSADLDVVSEYEQKRKKAIAARKEYQARKKSKDRARRKLQRLQHVPEGILIYRLDTSNCTIDLISEPSNNTNLETLVKSFVVASSSPSNDPSRRGIDLISVDGTQVTLVACEQRTAIAWLEAMDLMLAGSKRKGMKGFTKKSESGLWAAEDLNQSERDQIENQYLNLAAYSNKLIRAGALPGKSGKGGGAGGIYYSVEFQSDDGEDYEEEALESIAKRRAVIKDSWDFYRMICSLLRDRRKYDEAFRKMQLDPVYAYLNSMTGLNDPGEDGTESVEKEISQKAIEGIEETNKTQLAESLVKKAEAALPSLVEICKALAGSLGMEEVGVGPIKDPQAAIRKAEKKYQGNLYKVTDYCRALVVVKDFPSLLALLELARDSFGPLIRRVKLSTLKADHKALSGGYRDCKINLELKDHICEIQIHLWPMYTVCGVDGFRHYRHCLEYSTDSFVDPYDALEGLDRKTMAELIVMAEEAVADTPLHNLEWYQEKFILDYFAEVGLFMKHGLDQWAELTLRTLVKLRCESPDIGPDHHETYVLNRSLEQVLRKLGKEDEAAIVARDVLRAEELRKIEKETAEKSLWDQFLSAPTSAYEMVADPNKKEREEQERMRKEVKASKKQWRRIRRERFSFLDSVQEDAMK